MGQSDKHNRLVTNIVFFFLLLLCNASSTPMYPNSHNSARHDNHARWTFPTPTPSNLEVQSSLILKIIANINYPLFLRLAFAVSIFYELLLIYILHQVNAPPPPKEKRQILIPPPAHNARIPDFEA